MSSTKDWYEEFYRSHENVEMPVWYANIYGMLMADPDWQPPVLELGCGRGQLIKALADSGRVQDDQVYAMEQSETALEHLVPRFPKVRAGDVTKPLPFPDETFGVVIMSEVIEHLSDPNPTLREIYRVLRPGGIFAMSFPNFMNPGWLTVRILAKVLNRPSWTNLQPIDHIYFYPILRPRIQRYGFRHERTVGGVFFPPLLHYKETPAVGRFFNRSGFGWMGLHPATVYRKSERHSGS
jgi:SAM-dependent methyltransferase